MAYLILNFCQDRRIVYHIAKKEAVELVYKFTNFIEL
jgi:hypothetical protein